jgi:molybdate transport system ATP-binding protein
MNRLNLMANSPDVLEVRLRHRMSSEFRPSSELKKQELNTRELSSQFSLEADFSVPAGITILFGPSGAGKSTLLDCIAGVRRPEAGRIVAGGQRWFDSDAGIDVPLRKRRVGYVMQGLSLFPHLSVQENVEYGLYRLPSRERAMRAAAMLETFKIGHLRQEPATRISGGERQRVALARVLVTEPAAVLLDEPLTALDAATRSRLIADLRAWNSLNPVPILCVTHNREEVFALGERLVAIDGGRLLAVGTPQELLQAPRHELLAQLAGFENIFDATVTACDGNSGTMTCQLHPEGALLEVPLGSEGPGDHVRIGIRAGDILLANQRPEGLSARNILAGRILRLEHRDRTVVAEVNCGATFQVHLTPGSQHSLRLGSSSEVWLIIKTYSCHLLRSS